ncbi:MAG: hypothetical protein GX877_01065 [Bacteroidales bacterium]|nr:hypothetical protein [Bacteroidales bacterium]
MGKLLLVLTGLALMLNSCTPQDAMDLDHFTQEQINVLQVLNGAFIVDENPDDQLIITEKYNRPKEVLIADLVTVLAHGKIKIPLNPEFPVEAYIYFYFYISEDGNAFTMVAEGSVLLQMVLDLEIVSESSFRMRPSGGYDDDWVIFTRQ